MTPRRPDSARCESRKRFDGSVHGGKVENVGKPLRKSPAQLMEICLEKPHPSVNRRNLPPSASITYLTDLTLTARSRHRNETTHGAVDAHRYAKLCRLEIQQAIRIVGLNELRIALKLAELIDATMPRGNPAKRQWDMFPDFTAQLEALKQIARLLNLYPAEPSQVEPEQVTVIVDVPL